MDDIDRIVQEVFEQNQLEKVNDKLYLTKNQIDILERYDIIIILINRRAYERKINSSKWTIWCR